MNNDTFSTEKAYTTSEIAIMIDIAEPTVRKYCQALEKAGYRFIKNEFGTRTYVERDAMALRQLKEIRSKTNMPVEQTAEVVASKYSNTLQSISPDDTEEKSIVIQQYDKQYGEIVGELTSLRNVVEEQSGQISRLIQMNEALYSALNELSAQKEIAATGDSQREERERLRDEKLTQVLREIQEAKQQANKSLWARIFGG